MADERVVPGKTGVVNLQKHITRYNLALMHCVKKDVLDLSCGTGYGSYLMGLVANKVVGVDISREAIDFAVSNFVKDNVWFVQKDILDLNLTPADTVVSFETIEHFKNIEAIQEKLNNLVKPGGSIIYSVPLYENYENKHHFHKFDLKKGLALFPEYENQSYVIQKGLNFINTDNKEPFTYLIARKTKPSN